MYNISSKLMFQSDSRTFPTDAFGQPHPAIISPQHNHPIEWCRHVFCSNSYQISRPLLRSQFCGTGAGRWRTKAGPPLSAGQPFSWAGPAFAHYTQIWHSLWAEPGSIHVKKIIVCTFRHIVLIVSVLVTIISASHAIIPFVAKAIARRYIAGNPTKSKLQAYGENSGEIT